MELKNKKVLVVGLAISGVPVVEVLSKLGARVTVNDIKTEQALGEVYTSLKKHVNKWILGTHPDSVGDYDLMVLSPGVPTDLPFITAGRKAGLEVVGELELAYRLSQGHYLAITGTNGKTTTTALVGEIMNRGGKPYEVVGNIGLAAISRALESKPETVFVAEVSSFQLETCSTFRPHIAAVLNLTPDHLNRHKTMANYIAAKAKIFENQSAEDYLVLNYDNEPTRILAQKAKSQIRYFSCKELKDNFTGIDKGWIVVRDGAKSVKICPVKELFIPGAHNVENALAATTIAYYAGVAPEAIAESLRLFRGVEHRIEWVAEFKGITFYNDSKGTNPDASIKAVEAMTRPTVLIAGGMDKGSVFDELIAVFGKTITHMILLGETKEGIQKTAFQAGFKNVTMVENMEEAVLQAWNHVQPGGNILLSPACASWDMYPSYEVRGRHFKDCVLTLTEEAHR